MALPYLDNPATLDETTVQELDGLVAKLNSFLSQQHNPEGGHGDITATSLVVDGPVTVRDEKLAPASFQRTVAKGTQIAITPTPGGTTPWLTVIYNKAEDVRLGEISGGIYGPAPGVRLGPNLPSTGSQPQPWDVVATSVGVGPALVVGDPIRHDRPLVLMFDVAGGRYELRPHAAAAEVWLGTAFGIANQFARAYLSNGVYQRGRAVSMGDWQDVPYAPGDFFASGGGGWGVDPGDAAVRRFTLLGQTMHYHLLIVNTDVTGVAPDTLACTLPSGYTVATNFVTPIIHNNAGAGLVTGYSFGTAGDTFVNFKTFPGLPWTLTAADNTSIYAMLTIEVTG